MILRIFRAVSKFYASSVHCETSTEVTLKYYNFHKRVSKQYNLQEV